MQILVLHILSFHGERVDGADIVSGLKFDTKLKNKNEQKTLTQKFNEFIDVDPKNVVSQVNQI